MNAREHEAGWMILFDSNEEETALAYNAAAVEYFGEFSNTNEVAA